MAKERSADDLTEGRDALPDSKVADTIGEWQEHLLQVDRRNNLLYFKGRAPVRLLIESIDDFLTSLSASKPGLAFLYAERRSLQTDQENDDEPDVYTVPGDIDADCAPLDLQKRLNRLRKRDREWEEEQGLNVLFLAIGLLEWIDADGQTARSPLILVPCDLLRASPRDPFRLAREEDDVVTNQTLAYVLEKQTGISLPEFSSDQAPSDYLSVVADLVRTHEGWRVHKDVHLATFQFSKMAMWSDLRQLRTDGVSNELVLSLAGGGSIAAEPSDTPSAQPAMAPDHLLAGGLLDDELDADPPLTVLQADFSQLRAIQSARSGHHLLVHGPPGTGKSQTIANMIVPLGVPAGTSLRRHRSPLRWRR